MYLFLVALAIFVIVIIVKGIIIVKQAEVVIIERLGRYNRTLTSGLHVIWPIVDKKRTIIWRYTLEDHKGNIFVRMKEIDRIDIRESVYDFPRQNVITSDNVAIEINALLYFQITDPMRAVYEIYNLPEAIEKLTQTTLRNVIGELDLDRTLTSRDTINSKLRDILDDATDKWGVKVNRVELQDISPPIEIRSAMEKQMRAERDKRAKILEAEGDKVSKMLVAEGDREAKITRAEGEAKAKILVAEAEAEAINRIAEAVLQTKTDPAQYLLAIKYINAFNEIAVKGDKTVLIPYEATSMLGSIKAISEIFNKQ